MSKPYDEYAYDTSTRTSDALRASVLNVALDIAARNQRVGKWLFDQIDEGEEEEPLDSPTFTDSTNSSAFPSTPSNASSVSSLPIRRPTVGLPRNPKDANPLPNAPRIVSPDEFETDWVDDLVDSYMSERGALPTLPGTDADPTRSFGRLKLKKSRSTLQRSKSTSNPERSTNSADNPSKDFVFPINGDPSNGGFRLPKLSLGFRAKKPKPLDISDPMPPPFLPIADRYAKAKGTSESRGRSRSSPIRKDYEEAPWNKRSIATADITSSSVQERTLYPIESDQSLTPRRNDYAPKAPSRSDARDYSDDTDDGSRDLAPPPPPPPKPSKRPVLTLQVPKIEVTTNSSSDDDDVPRTPPSPAQSQAASVISSSSAPAISGLPGRATLSRTHTMKRYASQKSLKPFPREDMPTLPELSVPFPREQIRLRRPSAPSSRPSPATESPEVGLSEPFSRLSIITSFTDPIPSLDATGTQRSLLVPASRSNGSSRREIAVPMPTSAEEGDRGGGRGRASPFPIKPVQRGRETPFPVRAITPTPSSRSASGSGPSLPTSASTPARSNPPSAPWREIDPAPVPRRQGSLASSQSSAQKELPQPALPPSILISPTTPPSKRQGSLAFALPPARSGTVRARAGSVATASNFGNDRQQNPGPGAGAGGRQRSASLSRKGQPARVGFFYEDVESVPPVPPVPDLPSMPLNGQEHDQFQNWNWGKPAVGLARKQTIHAKAAAASAEGSAEDDNASAYSDEDEISFGGGPMDGKASRRMRSALVRNIEDMMGPGKGAAAVSRREVGLRA